MEAERGATWTLCRNLKQGLLDKSSQSLNENFPGNRDAKWMRLLSFYLYTELVECSYAFCFFIRGIMGKISQHGDKAHDSSMYEPKTGT